MLKYLKVIFVFLLISCNRSELHDSIEMKWKILNRKLPNNISLYKGHDPSIPIKAWSVVIPYNNSSKNTVKILTSSDHDGLETPESFAIKNNALVVINGGYFSKGKYSMHHVGLLKTNGVLKEPASSSVIRDNIRYNINRGAFGVFDDGKIDIGWASTKNDSIFIWVNPIKNRPGSPGILDYKESAYWKVFEALHAGPILINEGEINITSEQEVFFNTPVDGVQPRSAIGYTVKGEIVIMVVDGRQVESRGVYLKELALLMSQFNCFEAINLDGGGSSALIVDGKLVNSPIGLNSQREVMSTIAILSED